MCIGRFVARNEAEEIVFTHHPAGGQANFVVRKIVLVRLVAGSRITDGYERLVADIADLCPDAEPVRDRAGEEEGDPAADRRRRGSVLPIDAGPVADQGAYETRGQEVFPVQREIVAAILRSFFALGVEAGLTKIALDRVGLGVAAKQEKPTGAREKRYRVEADMA